MSRSFFLKGVMACLLCVPSAGAQVIINEFLASNQSVLADEDGDFSDWIELHNTSGAPVNLNGWHLTDNANNLTKWQLPNTNIAANGYLIVFASNKDRAVPGGQLHTDFALGAGGEYLGLVLPNGTAIVSEFAPQFPEQFGDVSYGIWNGEHHFFATPTPGAPNNTNFFAAVADTKFSHNRGFYSAPFNLAITTATAGATIRYTTNGSPPSLTNGLVYSAPILVSRTTVIRAAGFKTGFEPANVDTQTYIFLDDVIHQSTNGLAPPGWPASWGANRVDYGMDLKVLNNPIYGSTIKDDLKAIPTISVVMKLEDLFSAATGIYANSTQTGMAWERPASLELIYPDGTEGFQVNAGLRIRGNFSASSTYPKHSFRCFFRGEYGDSSLDYPLFGESGTDSFPGGIDLATFQNHTWSNWGNPGGTNALFLRDHFGRDTQLAMGHQGERGIYTHLYINGLYWGIYSPSERPEASFAATYYGGQEEDYDVVKATGNTEGYVIEATDGDMEAWTRLWQFATNGFASDANYQRVQGNNPDGSRNPAYEILVDVDNLIDYQLIAAYTGSRDAPVGASGTTPNNWYGIHRRDGTMGFRFFVHDFEHSLLNVNENRIGPYIAGTPGTGGGLPKSSPQYIWQQLQQNLEFRMRVADRVHRHFFNGGVLTPEACIARFKERTNQLHHALVGESARWGDADPNHNIAYTRNGEWLPLVDRMLNNYFPVRSEIVLNQLIAKDLYPEITAPSFDQHGGTITNGFSLLMSAPAGTIYFTLDGSDPRLPGGGVSPSAQTYSAPVSLTENVTVKSRVRLGNEWSALNEAPFVIIRDLTGLLITEIMYHPPDEGDVDGEEFEFIELKNASSAALDLSGVQFANGIQFVFPNGSVLGAGEFFVLVSNPNLFTNKYPGTTLQGVYSGRLSNSGEQLSLVQAWGDPVITLSYSDDAPWPTTADGDGFSLVPRNANFNPDPNNPLNWRASASIGGSPGSDDPSPNFPPVVINEILTHSDPPLVDFIELYNPAATNAPIGGWWLTDNRNSPQKFRIPFGTTVSAGEYLVFTASQFNANPGSPTNFLLSSHGEEVYLFSADAAGNLTGYSDGFSFGAASNGVSFGRLINSADEVKYPAQVSNTPGAPNAGPRIGPVVINEIRYHPVSGETEFVELKNISAATVKLYDPTAATNTWRLAGAGFDFPMNVEMSPGALLILTPGDPVAFRSKHNVPAEVQIFGGWTGSLQDNGELLELQRPDKPDMDPEDGVIVPYITVDDVRYRDQSPWPLAAANAGSSLERIDSAAYGNDPANWKSRAHGASPGLENSVALPPYVDAGADIQMMAENFPASVALSGAVIDDDEQSSLTIQWSQVAGPETVQFSPVDTASTMATFPASGTYILRLSANDGSAPVHDDVSVTIARQNYPITFVPPNSDWKYLDTGIDQGVAWRHPGFSDSGWASGPAQFGYGDGDEDTIVSFGPVATNKYITTYFRKTFQVPDPGGITALTVKLLRDDGGVVYLNGQEIFRSNLPQGAITANTLALSVVGGAQESIFYETNVPVSLLLAGNNVLAVEIHQANRTGTDMSFDLELSGISVGTNRSPVVNAGTNIVVTLPQSAMLYGQVTDDGLPGTSGLQVAWTKLSGPGNVLFANSNSPITSASFSASGLYGLQLSANDGEYSSNGFITAFVLAETYASWGAQYFSEGELSNPNLGGAQADPDADGFNNQQEFIAGTHPRDAESYLRLQAIPSEAGEAKLQFTAAARRSYSIQHASEPNSGVWIKLTDVPAEATERPVQLEHAFAPGTARFYRIVTPSQP